MFSPHTRRNIARIIPFGVIWFFSGLVFMVVEQAAIGAGSQIGSAGIELTLGTFIFGTLAHTLVGLLVGTVEVFYLGQAFAKKSFLVKIASKLVFYVLLVFVITLITYPIAASLELDVDLFDPEVWNKLGIYLGSLNHLSTDLQLAVEISLSLFYAEISDNIGHGVLLNFLTGKYHQPIEEKRIFMFSDMKSSTTIAEALGHVRYFELLKEYYSDLSDAIVRFSGEVYQYVGDEIIVSWQYPAGTDNANCIRCFFAMQEDLAKRADWYRENFSVAPTFKAGLHSGMVTTGEIGVIKKDIIFTGDVLNATARLQALCNELEVDILISEDLVGELDFPPEYGVTSLGQKELRGRHEILELFTIV